MALKDIDKIIRADRYTQDGRDEVCKALEKETEDKTYNIGEISQTTGLQKTANGWVKPKKARTGAGKNVHGAEIDRIYEKHQNRIKELKAKGYTDEQIENDKVYQQTKEDMRNVGKKESKLNDKWQAQRAADDPRGYGYEEPPNKSAEEARHEQLVNEYWQSIRKAKHSPVSRVAAELERGTFDDAVINTMGDGKSMEDLARDLISPAFEDDGYIPQDKLDQARRFINRRYRMLEEKAISGDCAPRKLTGDCKVKVRKG